MTKEEVKRLVLEKLEIDEESAWWEPLLDGSEYLVDPDGMDIGVTISNTEIRLHESEPGFCKFSLDDCNKEAIIKELDNFFDLDISTPTEEIPELKSSWCSLSVSILDGDKDKLHNLAKLISKTCEEQGITLDSCLVSEYKEGDTYENDTQYARIEKLRPEI